MFQKKMARFCLLLGILGLFAICDGMQKECSGENDNLQTMKKLIQGNIKRAAEFWSEHKDVFYSSQEMGSLLKLLISEKELYLNDILIRCGGFEYNYVLDQIKSSYYSLIKDLVSRADKDSINDSFSSVIRLGNHKEIELIMPYADLDARNQYGETPLHEALSSSYGRWVADKTVGILLKAGKQIDPTVQDKCGWTLLHSAVSCFVRDSASFETVIAIKNKGVSLEIPNNEGKTPLDLAYTFESLGGDRASRAKEIIPFLK